MAAMNKIPFAKPGWAGMTASPAPAA